MSNPFRAIGDRLWEWRAARRYLRTLGRRQKLNRERAEVARELRAWLGLMPQTEDGSAIVRLAWEAVAALERSNPEASADDE